jgi:hypothetical protein
MTDTSREDLWSRVYAAVIVSGDGSRTPAGSADNALKEFDERFRQKTVAVKGTHRMTKGTGLGGMT